MTADEMLRRANECRVRAQAAKEPGSKATYTELAKTWERLALRRSLAEIELGYAPTANDNTPEHSKVMGQ
jgi:hypothetical protein